MAPVVVQRLMGHKDIGITLNTYTSVFDKFKGNEIDKVNKYYLNENLTLKSPSKIIEPNTQNESEKEL